jgi:hypothetical protein
MFSRFFTGLATCFSAIVTVEKQSGTQKENDNMIDENKNGEEQIDDESDYGDDMASCAWCDAEYLEDELKLTDRGMLCDKCIGEIRSRGEKVNLICESEQDEKTTHISATLKIGGEEYDVMFKVTDVTPTE